MGLEGGFWSDSDFWYRIRYILGVAGSSRCGEADGGGRRGELVRLPDDRLVVDLHIEGWDEDDYSVIA